MYIIQKRLDLPVMIDNNINAFVLSRLGAGRAAGCDTKRCQQRYRMLFHRVFILSLRIGSLRFLLHAKCCMNNETVAEQEHRGQQEQHNCHRTQRAARNQAAHRRNNIDVGVQTDAEG